MTLLFIVLTSIISLIAFNQPKFKDLLIHNPYLVKHKNQWYRLFTSGFLHADFIHLFFNLFVLFSFGKQVEYYYQIAFNTKADLFFVLLYLISIFASNLATQYKYQQMPMYNSLGASGAVSAVLFTSILFNPYHKIYIYGIIGLPGILLGIIYLVYSYYMGKKQQDDINHDAHFYGAIFGILFTISLKPALALAFVKLLTGL